MTEMIMVVIPVLILAVFVFLLWYLWKMNLEKKAGFTVRDERTTRIEGKAARITVHVTGYFMLCLLFYYVFADNIVEGAPILETGWALIISVLFNSLLYACLILYFRKKED
jgi:uncharacterized membrane protein